MTYRQPRDWGLHTKEYIEFAGGTGIWVDKERVLVGARVRLRTGIYYAKATGANEELLKIHIRNPPTSGFIDICEDHSLIIVPYRQPRSEKKLRVFDRWNEVEMHDGTIIRVGDEVSVSYFLDTHPGRISSIMRQSLGYQIIIQTYETEPAREGLPPGHQEWNILWDNPRRLETTFITIGGIGSNALSWPGFLWDYEPARRFKDWERT